jgi:hypothetical protein
MRFSMEQVIDRFLEKIIIKGDCWLWTGYCDKGGYGTFRCDGKHFTAHRFAYHLANGEVPTPPLVIRHKCIHKNCVNPEHLEPGTQLENQQDRVRDGTTPTGSRNPFSKLTEAQVLEIRRRHNEIGKLLAAEFNVSRTTISCVINRTLWKHI